MYSEGVSLKKNARLLEIMDDNGLGRIGGGTLLNYKAKLTKKAWLIRTGSRLDLMPLLKGMCDTNSFDLRLAFLETEGE